MKHLFIILLALGFISCSHHKDVRPSADGVHRVEIMAESKEQGARNALDQANYFCEKRQKAAAIVKEEAVYEGEMNESDYKSAKKASKAAQILGGSTHVLGGRKESKVGGVVGLGGVVADEVIGKGYRIKMMFKCI